MATKNGFTAARTNVGGAMGQMQELPVANNSGQALFPGDPIMVSAGYARLAGNTNTVVGVYKGVRFIDADGKPTYKAVKEAAVSSSGTLEGHNTPLIQVETVEDKTFFIVADATVTQGLVGQAFEISAGAGDVTSKRSTTNLKVASATASAVPTSSMVLLVGRVNGVDNPVYGATGTGSENFDSATPLVEVKFLRTRSNIV